MLARGVPSILPMLTVEESLDITGIHSVAGTLKSAFVSERPFRSPHHTTSGIALAAAADPRPGEVSQPIAGFFSLMSSLNSEKTRLKIFANRLKTGKLQYRAPQERWLFRQSLCWLRR